MKKITHVLCLSLALVASLTLHAQPLLQLEVADVNGYSDINVTGMGANTFAELGWRSTDQTYSRVAMLPLTLRNVGDQDWVGPVPGRDPGFAYWLGFPFLSDFLGTTFFASDGRAIQDRISGALFRWPMGPIAFQPRIPAGGKAGTLSRLAIVDLEPVLRGEGDGIYYLSIETDPLGNYSAYAESFLLVHVEAMTVRILEPTPLQAAAAADRFLAAVEADPTDKDALRVARKALRSLQRNLK